MTSTNPMSIFDYKQNFTNKYNSNYKTLFCKNCGKCGHIYKFCNQPIISLGIVLFKKINNTIKYLIIRRKDSIGYVEFIRGKYALNDLKYMKKIINEMSISEKKKILKSNFKELWKNLWMENNNNIVRDSMEGIATGKMFGEY